MILIADSGSTKCDWILVRDDNTRITFSTIGFNPLFQDEKKILAGILANKKLTALSNNIDKVFLYSAGCHNKELKLVLERGLKKVFTHAKAHIDHDLVAAAYATYDGSPGISCILGTGSNSCFFDSETVRQEVPALGYILGDEGSGSYYGKILLKKFLYKQLPGKIHRQLLKQFKLSKEIIFENVYRKSHANVYLATFMPVLSENKSDSFVKNLIAKGMEDFMTNHVMCFKNYKKVNTHFIGSIAFYFEDILRQVAKKLEINDGTVLHKPIDALVDYHLKYILK